MMIFRLCLDKKHIINEHFSYVEKKDLFTYDILRIKVAGG